jgi:hypothetical protein
MTLSGADGYGHRIKSRYWGMPLTRFEMAIGGNGMRNAVGLVLLCELTILCGCARSHADVPAAMRPISGGKSATPKPTTVDNSPSLQKHAAQAAHETPHGKLDGLLAAIHEDFLEIRATAPWLKEYGDSNMQVWEQERVISYAPTIRPADLLPQMPDQMHIRAIPVSYDYSRDKGGANSDDFHGKTECRFPEVGLRLRGGLVIRGEGAQAARQAIEAIVSRRCAEWHAKFAAKP